MLGETSGNAIGVVDFELSDLRTALLVYQPVELYQKHSLLMLSGQQPPNVGDGEVRLGDYRREVLKLTLQYMWEHGTPGFS